jgi:hypothetical protein
LGHFLVQEALALAVRLHPFAVDHKLRDGAFASAGDHLVGGSGCGLDVDFLERQVVALEEALGFAAVGAPEGGLDNYFHG